MKYNSILILLSVFTLFSCKSTFSELSEEEYSDLSYVLPSISITDGPNYHRIYGKRYVDSSDRDSDFENPDNRIIEFYLKGIIDSIVRVHNKELGIIDPPIFGYPYLNEQFRSKLGNYYLKILRKNPKKVESPYWLKDIFKNAKTNKIVAFTVYNIYSPNGREGRDHHSRKVYVFIWKKNGELLVVENSDVLSEGIKEAEFDKAWQKTIFKLLKK